jgi:hypothetical protein
MENSFYIRELGLPRTALVNINYMNSMCLELGVNTMKEILFGFYQHTQFFSQVLSLKGGGGNRYTGGWHRGREGFICGIFFVRNLKLISRFHPLLFYWYTLEFSSRTYCMNSQNT